MGVLKPLINVVTVIHNDENAGLAMRLIADIGLHHPGGALMNVITVDNRDVNRGFAKGCNLGAAVGDAPVIGFLNPDVRVRGSFLTDVYETLAYDERVVITGKRYGKPELELREWGVTDWVCGATMFVKRSFWEEVGGFDEQFVWSHEETDLIRQAEAQGYITRPIDLPIDHESPTNDNPDDVAYKRYWFAESQRLYRKKWADG